MNLEFKTQQEFEEFMFETIRSILEYVGSDEEKFKTFCTTFYSVIYCEGYDERFHKITKEVKEAMNNDIGQLILQICKERIAEIRKKD